MGTASGRIGAAATAASSQHGAGVIGLLGGTFDPIHYGHLRFAAEIQAKLGFDQLRLVPAGRPGHRPGPSAGAADRLAMARLAIAEFPGLTVDDREVRRKTPSYTVDTLEELRSELGDRPLAWLIGADAFCGLPTWHRWQALFALTHFVVTERPGFDLEQALPGPLRAHWAARRIVDPRALGAAPGGTILVRSVSPQPISASELRHRIAAGEEVRGLLPVSVMDYIRSHRLYGSPGCA